MLTVMQSMIAIEVHALAVALPAQNLLSYSSGT